MQKGEVQSKSAVQEWGAVQVKVQTSKVQSRLQTPTRSGATGPERILERSGGGGLPDSTDFRQKLS